MLSSSEVCKEWHPLLNSVSPDEVSFSSGKKVWWLGECGHEWEAVVWSRTVNHTGCPFCAGQKVLAGFNDFATTHPEIAAQWHPTRNGELTPVDVTAFSNRKVWWLGECGHEWEVYLSNRTRHENGCPFCAGQKVLAGFNDLATTHPNVASQWHPVKNVLRVDSLSRGSNKKVWWLCDKGHEWEATVNKRTQGRGCPVCAGRKVLPGYNDIVTTHVGKAETWSGKLNGDLKPEDFVAGSHRKVWWSCEKGHEWEASVANRLLNNGSGTGCPACVNVSVAEGEVYRFLVELLPGVKVIQSERKILRGKELDIYLPEKNVAVEFNGLYWHSEAAGKGKYYHYDKWKACKDKGIQLIQIWEDDWKYRSELVKRMLAYKLGVGLSERFYARRLNVERISSEVAVDFLGVNHLQGYRVAKYFGLTFVDGGVSRVVAVLGVALKKSTMTLEIVRFATVGSVVGGFSKLLKYVLGLDEYEGVGEVLSYSHNDYSDGGVYFRNGFELVHEGSPGYSYVSYSQPLRKNRLSFSVSAVSRNPDLKYVEGYSERQLAELNKVVRVWDSGSSLWRLVV